MAGGAGVLVALASIGITLAPPAAATATGPKATAVGSAPRLPADATERDAVAASTPLHLTVVLQPRDPAGLAAMAESVSTPGSPNYHQYLAPGEFAGRYGPTAATIANVDQALTGLGLNPGTVSGNGLAIGVTTTAGAAASAFAVHLNHVHLSTGRIAYANDKAPSLPSTVAPDVTEILGLDDLAQARPAWEATTTTATAAAATATAAATTTAAKTATAAAATTAAKTATAAAATTAATKATATGPQPCSAATNAATRSGGYTANQITQAYSFGGLYAQNTLGAGETVAVYELASYHPSDIAAFQSCYGTSATVTNISVDGGPNPTDPGAIEVELDIEGVISMAPKANIEVYLGPNGSNTYDVYNQIVSDDTAKVVTTSWGNCEAAESLAEAQQENTLFEEAAVQGQTILAAAGDSGSEDCYGETSGSTAKALEVDDPGTQPFVTDVGGTSLTAIGASPTETVWNDQQDGSGGGGISQFWPMPTAQHGPGVVNAYSTRSTCGAAAGTYCREVPDVSAAADPAFGYVIYYTGSETGVTGWQAIGGTSAAAPLWAALVALANQGCACDLGFLNTALYNVAAAQSSGGAKALNDIITGNNDYLGNHAGTYPATAGYDMASGLGTPIATNLVAQLDARPAKPAFTSDGPPAGNVGTPYSYTYAATGTPAPTFAVSGPLPPGLALNATSGVLSGTPTQTTTATFTVTATNSGGSASIVNQITIDPAPAAPAFTSPAATTDTVGIAGSFQISATGYPTPTVTESGTLPSGVTFNQASASLTGTPTQGTAGTYPVTFSAANAVSTANQAFTLTVNQATFTYPTNGQAGVDTTKPFTWSTIAQAQAYDLIVGTTQYGANLVSSGVLQASKGSYNVPALPTGSTLYATLYTEVSGAWTYQAITFTAAAGEATLTFPLNGQTSVDPTRAFTWSTIPQAQGYDLAVGTSQYGSNVVNSGVLPSTQSSYAGPTLPTGETLYATLLTETNGAWTRFQAVTFTAGPAMATFTTPLRGQAVTTPTTFAWTTLAAAQNYDLVVGTTQYGSNLVSSGLLSPTTSSFSVPALPAGQTLFATLLTEVNGTWTFRALTFTSM